jgi:Lrp/AsnC family leucine-responsive transcriptional regulator
MNRAIDALDRRILLELERDGSLSNIDLATRVHASPATCLRRVARLKLDGVIQSIVALLDPALVGTPLTALIEVTLDRQDAQSLDLFEQAAAEDGAVRQCYRITGGVDFALMIYVADMDEYHRFAHRLLASQANVRNVRTLFSTYCAKFDTRRLPLAD